MDPPTPPGCRICRVCRGPVQAGFALCYQCDLARSEAGDVLADAVVPVGYAVKGEQLAADLRRYKSGRDGAAEATQRLRSMLAEFLREGGASVWRAAGMTGTPSAVAVVPSGQGRPGAHPLTGIVLSCVELPLTRLTVRLPAQPRHRGISLDWLSVRDIAIGADVLLVDDTWVSGGSAQSAAAALKLAGARHVALVVLGRHVDPADPRSAGLLLALRAAAKPRAGSRPG
jgi:hypothetical protein